MSVVLLGSTSGSITLQEPAVAGTNTVNFGANTGVAILDANTPAFRNRIINGEMVIDQRNAGASVTANNAYTLDRWITYNSASSKYTVQQNAGSVTPPVGFTKYLGCTSTSSYSLGAGDYFFMGQLIEGYNIADLGWGTANASTVTLSFWVRSSLTGTFGGTIQAGSSTRSYPYTYTINSANTWEQKFITIAGDTTGTWLTNNGVGIGVYFAIGVGSTYSGTAGSWSGNNYFSATGATSVVGTNGATFYITGVQFEKGTQATSFDFRSIGTETALCQRYYAKMQNDGTGADATLAMGMQQSTSQAFFCVKYPVTMRAEPTVAISGLAVGDQIGFTNAATLGSIYPTYDTATVTATFTAAGAQYRPCCLLILNNVAGFIAFSSEL